MDKVCHSLLQFWTRTNCHLINCTGVKATTSRAWLFSIIVWSYWIPRIRSINCYCRWSRITSKSLAIVSISTTLAANANNRRFLEPIFRLKFWFRITRAFNNLEIRRIKLTTWSTLRLSWQSATKVTETWRRWCLQHLLGKDGWWINKTDLPTSLRTCIWQSLSPDMAQRPP